MLILVTTAQVAQRLNKSHRTIHRMVKAGILKPALTTPGGPHGAYMFDTADVEALAETSVA